MRIAVVVGTRPEAIKLAPVIKLLDREALVVHTGQHYSAGMSGHLTADLLLDTCEERDITRGRQLDHLADLCCAPTPLDQLGLRNCGV